MIIRCEKGHYYDNSKFANCPHCSGSTLMKAQPIHQQEATGTISSAPIPGSGMFPGEFPSPAMGEERTVAKYPGAGEDHTEQFCGEDSEKTMGIFASIRTGAPVVGWLVCVEGPERGRDYRLHAGRNFVGRSWKADVCVVEDRSITRENHASIVFDPRSCSFSLLPGDSVMTTLNGKSITAPHPLFEGDRVGLGQSLFDFVPYCKGEVTWE